MSLYTIVDLATNACVAQRGQGDKVFSSLARVDFPDAANTVVFAAPAGHQIGPLVIKPVQIDIVGAGTLASDSEPVYSGGDHAVVTRTLSVDTVALARSQTIAAMQAEAAELEKSAATESKIAALRIRLKIATGDLT